MRLCEDFEFRHFLLVLELHSTFDVRQPSARYSENTNQTIATLDKTSGSWCKTICSRAICRGTQRKAVGTSMILTVTVLSDKLCE